MPFNPALHAFLTDAGFGYSHHEASWEDVGDAENGPELTGGPAFDEYFFNTQCVYVTI